MTVNTSLITWTKNGAVWSGCVEASSLGWQPGVWPHHFYVQGVEERRRFSKVGLTHSHEDEIVGCLYEDQISSIKLQVDND